MSLLIRYSAAGAAMLFAASLGASAAAAASQVGVAAAVNPDSVTVPPDKQAQSLRVGHSIVLAEKITTGAEGPAQLLMMDQSAVTVSPNSELVIDRFVYNPDTRTGEMALNLAHGLMRYVGGRLSKTGDVKVQTPVAVMAIRGGIALVHVVSPSIVDVTLLYGDAIEGETASGQRFALHRPGYFTRIELGQPPTTPRPAAKAAVRQSLARLQTQADDAADTDDRSLNRSEQRHEKAAERPASRAAGTQRADTRPRHARASNAQTPYAAALAKQPPEMTAMHEASHRGRAHRHH